MALKYKAVLLDFDGTIMDSEPGIIRSAVHTLEKMGLCVPDDKTMEKMIGPPIRVCLRDVMGVPEDRLEEATLVYREDYEKNGAYDAAVFDGMEELLAELCGRGVKCAVASIKSERVVREMAGHFDITKYFAAICGSDGGPAVVDKGHIVLDGLRRLGVKKNEAVLVGDSDYDAVGARQAGVDFCAAMWGFGFRRMEDLHGYACRYVARDIAALRRFLIPG